MSLAWTGDNVDDVVRFIHRQLDEDPLETPHHERFVYWSFKHAIIENDELRERLISLMKDGVAETRATVGVLWSYLTSTALDKKSSERQELTQLTFDAVTRLLQRDINGPTCGKFSGNEKKFIKMCLSFCHPQRYSEEFKSLQKTCSEVMESLARPLNEYYQSLQGSGNPLLTLHEPFLNENSPEQQYLTTIFKDAGSTLRQHELMPEGFVEEMLRWYEKTALKEQYKSDAARDFYEKYNFDWRETRKLRMKDSSYHGGRLTLLIMKQLANRLQPHFQEYCSQLYRENREREGLSVIVPGQSHLGPRFPWPPVKTISRGQHKSFREYTNREFPREFYIVDFLRTALIMQTPEELISMFWYIMENFRGYVARVKNGFDEDAEVNYGYRAVMINIIYPKEKSAEHPFQMVGEIQLILKNYLTVRSKMHAYYKVVRAKEQWAIGRDTSQMWDL